MIEQADRDWIIKYFERLLKDQNDAFRDIDAATKQRLDRVMSEAYEWRAEVKERLGQVERRIWLASGGIAVVALIGIANLIRLFTS